MKMQFVPASHGQNTLGTDVPRIIRHDGAKNRVGRVPGTRTGAADLDYEGNVYTEKRVMWETLSPALHLHVAPEVCPSLSNSSREVSRWSTRVNLRVVFCLPLSKGHPH